MMMMCYDSMCTLKLATGLPSLAQTAKVKTEMPEKNKKLIRR